MIARATRHFDWYSARTRYFPGPSARGIEVVDSAGATRGMVIFDDWTPASVRMHVALGGAGSGRVLLRAAFDFAFNQCDKQIATAVVPAGSRAHRLAESLGFVEEARVTLGFDGNTDLTILTMERHRCRYIDRKEAA